MRGGTWHLCLPLMGVVWGCSPAAPPFDVQVDTVAVEDVLPFSPSVRFAAVRDIILSDGFLWILDSEPPFLTRLDPETGESLQVGYEGDGPGEFRDPSAIQPAVDTDPSHVLVWDFGALRVSEFDQDGAFLSSDRLSEEGGIRARSDFRDVSYGNPFRVRNHGQSFLMGQFPGRIDRTADLLSGSLTLTTRWMEPGITLQAFSTHGANEVGQDREWASVPFWDSCDGVVAFLSPSMNGVQWIDGRGGQRAERQVEIAPKAVEPADIQRYLEWMARLELGTGYPAAEIDFEALAHRYEDRFSPLAPVATDLRCESEKAAWIRLFDTSHDPLGRGPEWLRVPQGAGAIRGVRFPPVFTPVLFSEGTVVGILENWQDRGQALALWRRVPTDLPDSDGIGFGMNNPGL